MSLMTATTDHPRVSGEHIAATATGSGAWGSSPRERGAHAVQIRVIASQRIIPA